MTVTLTWESVVALGSFVTAAALLGSRVAKGVRWFDRQQKQDSDLQALSDKHDRDMTELRQTLSHDMGNIMAEQQLLTYGVLSCLKGLQEKGCNGPVTEAINKIDKYLNQKAHEN